MCAGDTTLEKDMVEDGVVVPSTFGWGVEHECRDFGAIYEFTKEGRSRNGTGIV